MKGKKGGIWLSGYFYNKRWFWELPGELPKDLEYTNWGLTKPKKSTSGCMSLGLSDMKWNGVDCGSSNYIVCERKV